MSLSYNKNIKASIKGLVVQLGDVWKKLTDSQMKTFTANTTNNPKEHCNTLVIEQEVTYDDTEVEEEMSDLYLFVEYFFGERRNEISCVLEIDPPQDDNVKYQVHKVLPYPLVPPQTSTVSKLVEEVQTASS